MKNKSNFTDRVNKLHKELVNKMLEKYHVNYDFVKVNPMVEGIHWTQYYQMTFDEYQDFRDFSIGKIRSDLRLTKEKSKHEFKNFMYQYGIKIQEYMPTTTTKEIITNIDDE